MKVAIVIFALLAFAIVSAFICGTCDTIERRWRLWRLRAKMSKQPCLTDDDFAASLDDLPAEDVIEMRNFLATILRVNPLKIHPDWPFTEEHHLKYPDRHPGWYVFPSFAIQYAPERLREQVFEFPIGEVRTVADLFREAVALKYDLDGEHTGEDSDDEVS